MPSKHLLEVNTTQSSSGWADTSSGNAPKADTASSSMRRPAARTTAPTAAGSWITPLPVSL
jgi:hypothetical protein